jgi:small subunit ribosomal protein S5
MATNRRKSNRAKEKETTFQERVIQIRRVSKVVKEVKNSVSGRSLLLVTSVDKLDWSW